RQIARPRSRRHRSRARHRQAPRRAARRPGPRRKSPGGRRLLHDSASRRLTLYLGTGLILCGVVGSPSRAEPAMRIGTAAEQAGVNVQTLRYYERRGLLPRPPRRESGYREFPDEAVGVVRFIKRAQDLGFSLEEVEELLKLRNDKRRD